MASLRDYAAIEALRDGRRLEIRALRPDDRADLVAAVDRTSAQSRFRRFFAIKRGFTEQEVAYFLNVDFVDHVALVAVVEEDGRGVIVGGGRYIVLKPGTAEVAFAVVDDYHGQGIGTVLMRHLAEIARRGGLRSLVADVLPENGAMLRVFEKSGLPLETTHEQGVAHIALHL